MLTHLGEDPQKYKYGPPPTQNIFLRSCIIHYETLKKTQLHRLPHTIVTIHTQFSKNVRETSFSPWDKCNWHDTNHHIRCNQPIFFYSQLRTTHHMWDRQHRTHLNLLLTPLSHLVSPNYPVIHSLSFSSFSLHQLSPASVLSFTVLSLVFVVSSLLSQVP